MNQNRQISKGIKHKFSKKETQIDNSCASDRGLNREGSSSPDEIQSSTL